MPTDRDDETGQFQEKYPTEAFLSAVDDLDLATTRKVAEHVGCSYDLAYRRLNALSDNGSLTKKDAGGSFVWQRTD